MFNEKPIISKWIADMYDQKVTETNDIDFLISIVGKAPKRIFEVSCGSGRILIPLAQAGHIVSGLDFDEYILSKIHAKARGLENIEWHSGDAVHGDWGTGYDVVVLAGNILYNLITEIDNAKAQELLIKKAAAALVPDGYVYIEYQPGNHRITQSEPSHKSESKWTVWEGMDSDGNYGRMMILGDDYDAETGLSTFTRRFELTLKNGETITQEIVSHKHFVPLEQLHEWLDNTGFAIEQEYGDCNGGPVTEESRGVVIYARKV